MTTILYIRHQQLALSHFFRFRAYFREVVLNCLCLRWHRRSHSYDASPDMIRRNIQRDDQSSRSRSGKNIIYLLILYSIYIRQFISLDALLSDNVSINQIIFISDSNNT